MFRNMHSADMAVGSCREDLGVRRMEASHCGFACGLGVWGCFSRYAVQIGLKCYLLIRYLLRVQVPFAPREAVPLSRLHTVACLKNGVCS